MISVITPTCDRPVAFGLCERWMARQTRGPDEWIVADGGRVPVVCTQGQVHLHQPRPSGAENFAQNLLAALARARGDLVVVIEDDDYEAPTHLERLTDLLTPATAWLAGDPQQRYYNVGRRWYRLFQNRGASLCQTAMRKSVLPLFKRTILTCLARRQYGIDAALWQAVPTAHWALDRQDTVIGMKGLPGQTGLGIGHRPDQGWTADPSLAVLRTWMGDDADVYAAYAGAAS
jgi:glycosyl transferase family 2